MKTYFDYISIHIPEHGDVDCEVEWELANDGIGAYEYWGARCVDYGIDYPEIVNIKPEQDIDIEKWLDDNWDAICNDVESKIDMSVAYDKE